MSGQSEWRKRLQPASFRGVPFEVDDESTPVGRDVVVHEYSKKDVSLVEDMGRKTRVYRFSAYVIGADCLTKRDALLKELDKRGSGELVHPWYGRLKVTPSSDCSVSHSRRDGGMVRFELSFIDSGALEFPSSTPNTAKQVQTSAENVRASASDRFKAALETVNMAKVKVNSIASSISSIYSTVDSYMRPLTQLFGSATGLLNTVMNAPANLSGMVFNTFGDLNRSFSSFTGSNSAASSSAAAITALASAPVPSGQDARQLHTAVIGLLQDAAVYDALLAGAEIPIVSAPGAPASVPDLSSQVAAPVAVAEVPVAADVVQARDALGEAIHAVALSASLAHGQTLGDARHAWRAHMSQVARGGLRIRSYTPAVTTPAVVLAYRLYQDAGRAKEIASRNQLRHPGFVPAIELQVARK